MTILSDQKFVYKRERLITPDMTPAIDFVLDEDMVGKIYAAWDESKFGQLLDFGGGVKAITVSMLLNAGQDFLVTIRGIGPKRAADVMESVREATLEVPYL